MDIAIIGGGLTGLTAAYELTKNGHRVTVFEKGKTLGGLVGGFTKPNWKWSLEFFYHHFFTNDASLIHLSKELQLEKDILYLRPVTSTFIKGNTYQLDSPMNLLAFPFLSPIDKMRTACILAFCKFNPFWKPLEQITAEKFFKTIGGINAWNILWNPLMEGKFGSYSKVVPASWLWARFHKRTMRLGYFRGGFRTFVDALVTAIKKHDGMMYTDMEIASIKRTVRNTKYEIRIKHIHDSYVVHRTSYFDKVIITTPSPIAAKLIDFPTSYARKLKSIGHLWAQTLILETKKPILPKIYWLNIMEKTFPFIAVVSHTNMIDSMWYGGNHITYIGNYLPDNHPFLTMTKEELLKKFLPYIQKINPAFIYDPTTSTSMLFTAPNAQPVHTLHYSQKAPPIQTPIPGLYVANLDSIFPWDRGTNYAVELGQNAAAAIGR